MKEVKVENAQQLGMLTKEVEQDKVRAWSIAKNDKRTIANVAFMQVWHCLQMAQIHVERNLDEGAVTFTPEFFRQPFYFEDAKGYHGDIYQEGLYHVVKYAAFFNDMVFIDEFPTYDGVIDTAMDILHEITFLAELKEKRED